MKRMMQALLVLVLMVSSAAVVLAAPGRQIWQGSPQSGGRQVISLATAVGQNVIHLGPRESSLTVKAPLGTKLSVYSPLGQGPLVQGVLNAKKTHLLFRLNMGSYMVQSPTMLQPASIQLIMPRFNRAAQ